MNVGPETSELLHALPPSMSRDLRDYLVSVDEETSAIFRAGGIPLNVFTVDRFLFLVVVRKIWLVADGQYRVLRFTQTELRKLGATELMVGGKNYGEDSAESFDVRRLRSSLLGMIEKNGLRALTSMESLREVALLAAEQTQ